MWTVVYMSQNKSRIDRILELLEANKIITMLKSSADDEFKTSLFEILVPQTEIEKAQEIIFESEIGA